MPGSTNPAPDTTGPGSAAAGVLPLDVKSQQLLAALADLGQQTAGDLAKRTGTAYSTVTPKLRKFNTAGLAASAKADNGQTVWQLTDTGRALARTLTAPAGDLATEGGTVAPTGALATTSPRDNDPHASTDRAVVVEALDEPDTPAQERHQPITDGDALDEPAPPQTDATGAEDAAADEPGDDITDLGTGTGTSIGSSDLTGAERDGGTTAEPDGTADVQTPDTCGVGPASRSSTTPDTSGTPSVIGSDPADASDADHTDTAPTAVDDAVEAADNTSTAHGADAAPDAVPGSSHESGLKRREPGALDRSILTILRSHPDRAYKVSELCKLINSAQEGTGLAKASAGAVVLAAQRLIARAQAVLAVEKPASFQLLADPAAPAAPASPAGPAQAPAPAATAAPTPAPASA
ncbi:hypothetical protein AB0H83_35160 [Dactylosporangium sp. NPDC050688]|uniref:hypothetical protein n=1 Tax=Dactylosporangium sp. NPDC050688 TaxID=3157217 RepID=UPI0033D12383